MASLFQIGFQERHPPSLEYHTAEACQEHLATLVSLGHNNSILVILGLDFLRCSARVLPVLGKEELYELFH